MWYAGFIREPTNRSEWSSRDDRIVARLRSDSTIERVRTELEAVAARIAVERSASNDGWTVTVEGLHESIVGGFRRVSWFLLATVVVVLLVAILNVGSLMVAHAVTRERETAVRAALGAGRLRLMSMLLAEASALTITGSLAGLLLAWWMVRALKAAAPPGIPRLDAIGLDWQALLAAGVSMAVIIGTFAIIPLWRRGDGQLALRLHTRSAGARTAPAGFAVRTALTIVQCAGAAVLVVLALLLTRSLVQLTSVDLGWNPAAVVRLNVSPRMPRIFEYVGWAERLVAELEAIPEVRRAAITTQVPLSADWYPSPVRSGGGEERWSAVVHSVTDNFFDTMGIQLLSGRLWQPDDRPTDAELTGRGRQIQGVAVVSAQTARTLWPDRPAIGETISASDFLDSVPGRVVVGVVEDIHFHAVGEPPALHVFIPWAQRPTGRPRLLVSTRDTTDASLAAVRTVVERFVPETRIESIVLLRDLVGRATAQPRFTSRIVAAFGGLALALAAVGIYGTLSYLVRARTREIGIRLALGAPHRAIVTSVLTRAMVPAIGGAAIGLVTAGGLAGAFRALLFNVDPLDRGAFAAGALVLLVVALAAALLPALRAARVDPAHTLRAE